MKLDTQRARWLAIMDGHELVSETGTRVKFNEYGRLIMLFKGRDSWEECPFTFEAKNWQLYEPPKPENKVIVIEAESAWGPNTRVKYKILGAYFHTENDAIRAAMEWIGEKAKRVALKRPDWGGGETRFSSGFSWTDRSLLREALLLRWPIEIIEEV